MFTFVTIFTATSIQFHSAAYINNREFSGTDEAPYPGPVGYQVVVINAISLISNIMFYLNNWLADGLLVSPVLNSVGRVTNICRSSSSIVSVLFIP